jgi:hypothetical protein
LKLAGTYTPYNYWQMDRGDVDLGGSSPTLLPSNLVAFGSKQGTVYLIDRDHLPGALDKRPPAVPDNQLRQPTQFDRSLLSHDPQTQFDGDGPLNVFGPYSEDFDNGNLAKMRSTTAYFETPGHRFLFVSGTTKTAVKVIDAKPPGLARLEIVLDGRQAASLHRDAMSAEVAFMSPGSPVVTSEASDHPVVWVIDANVQRLDSLVDPHARHPILWAIDGQTLEPLWRSPPGELAVGGKYEVPAFARGVVFVGTDRIQTYGVTNSPR